MALSMAGGMAAITHSFAPDEILKNTFANFAFENFEIAAYRSLITLAQNGGFQNALSVLQSNLREEEAMATWIESTLQAETLHYASLREMGETAKI
jgi:ferritin-like metal-binding protein YciE